VSSPASSVERRIAARHDRVAEAIAVVVAELTVRKRLPLETALTNAALGNRVHEVFTANGGKGCERTVRDDIRELLGGPAGQMPDQLRELFPGARGPFQVKQRGASTFNLLAVADDKLRKRLLWRIHALIALFARLTRRRVNCNGVTARSPSTHAQCRLTANALERSVSRALDRAIGDAEGQRNNVGYRLAWRCRYLGLDQHEVEAVMQRYQQEIGCWPGGDGQRYMWPEARATVRSVFLRSPRGTVAEWEL
jgi:hypothetical protein